MFPMIFTEFQVYQLKQNEMRWGAGSNQSPHGPSPTFAVVDKGRSLGVLRNTFSLAGNSLISCRDPEILPTLLHNQRYI